MKKIFIYSIMVFLFTCSCIKDPQPKILPSVIYVSGLVTDKQTLTPLDSVNITLEYKKSMDLMGIFIPQAYFITDNNGEFNFEFLPKDNYTYHLIFEKLINGDYKYKSISINKDKEYQEFNIIF